MKPVTLLAVDDRPDNLFVLREIVAANFPDSQLLTATSAAEGLELARRNDLDAVLLDVQMPDISGIEMCRQLKADERSGRAPVLLITAHRSSAQLRAEGLDAGADDFISKPIDNTELVAKIRVLLRTKRAEDRLRRLNTLLEDLVEDRTRALREERDLLSTTLNTVSALVMVLDREDRVVRFNRACELATGATSEEVAGRLDWLGFVPAQDQETIRSALRRLHRGEQPPSYRTHLVGKDGVSRLIDWASSPLTDDNGELQQIVCTGVDITDRVQAEGKLRDNERRLAHLAHHDELTGLPNRLLFRDRLRQALTRSRRSNRPIALLFIDLDGFKTVNDVFGHEVGDDVLRAAAERLRSCLRAGDTVARLGGDEFTIIIENLGDPMDASIVASKALRDLGRPFTIDGQSVTLGGSIGISISPTDGDDSDAILRSADAAMYQAKEAGKSCFRYFTPDVDRRVRLRASAEDRLRSAIGLQELELHYQPQVAVDTAEIIGAEALVRWRHPELGLVSPADFIPLAERSGLIVELTEWVARKACQQNASWQRRGCRMVPVSINISPRHFQRGGLQRLVEGVLEDSQLDPRWLELELTEAVVMAAPEEAINTLEGLQRLGVTLSLDDFGCGYSSFSHLRRLPIHKLKIARPFVRDIGASPSGKQNSEAVVMAIIHLARDLGLTVVAEGVETEQQKQFLSQGGCASAQGFLFGRPVLADHFWDGLYAPAAQVSAI